MKGKERGLFFFFCLLRWIISNVRVIHFIFDLPGCKKRNQEQEQTIKIIFVFFFFLKKKKNCWHLGNQNILHTSSKKGNGM